MKKTLLIIPSLLLLTGCFEDRKNPLIEADPQDTILWFEQIATEQMNNCAVIWATENQNQGIKMFADICDQEKTRVLAALNQGQYTDEEIIADDLESPTPWLRYVEKLKSKKSLENALKPIPKKSKSSSTPEQMQKRKKDFWGQHK